MDRIGTGEPVHVAVEGPDGAIIDISGAHPKEEIERAVSGGGAVRLLVDGELGRLVEEHDWAAAAPSVARAWVPVALAQLEAAPLAPMRTPTMTYRCETESGIEVRITWDGDPEFAVDVRSADGRSGWREYRGVRFPPDPDGICRYPFTEEFFEDLALGGWRAPSTSRESPGSSGARPDTRSRCRRRR